MNNELAESEEEEKEEEGAEKAIILLRRLILRTGALRNQKSCNTEDEEQNHGGPAPDNHRFLNPQDLPDYKEIIGSSIRIIDRRLERMRKGKKTVTPHPVGIPFQRENPGCALHINEYGNDNDEMTRNKSQTWFPGFFYRENPNSMDHQKNCERENRQSDADQRPAEKSGQ